MNETLNAPAATRVILAEVEHLDRLAPLFDAYRVFYGQKSSLPASSHFLFERMINHDSVIYLALDEHDRVIGFTQLYPTFSSITLEPEWILNDLYVDPAARRRGVARMLIDEAKRLVRERGDKGLQLQTAHDNTGAQRLYESLGFTREETFAHYGWLRD